MKRHLRVLSSFRSSKRRQHDWLLSHTEPQVLTIAGETPPHPSSYSSSSSTNGAEVAADGNGQAKDNFDLMEEDDDGDDGREKQSPTLAFFQSSRNDERLGAMNRRESLLTMWSPSRRRRSSVAVCDFRLSAAAEDERREDDENMETVDTLLAQSIEKEEPSVAELGAETTMYWTASDEDEDEYYDGNEGGISWNNKFLSFYDCHSSPNITYRSHQNAHQHRQLYRNQSTPRTGDGIDVEVGGENGHGKDGEEGQCCRGCFAKVSPSTAGSAMRSLSMDSTDATMAAGYNGGNRRKVNFILDELITTERTYVRELRELVEFYVAPFDIACNSTDMDATLVATAALIPAPLRGRTTLIFGNIPDLLDLHERHILSEFQCHSNSVTAISHVLSTNRARFLAHYRPYCQNKPSSEQLRTAHSVDQAKFFVECQRKAGHLLPLSSYLLKPVQRITKYQLLLKELARHCADAEHTAVDAALHSMLDLLAQLNSDMQQLHILGFPGDLRSLGPLRLQAECDVYIYKRAKANSTKSARPPRLSTKPQKRHLFLFDGGVLFCKRRSFSQPILAPLIVQPITPEYFEHKLFIPVQTLAFSEHHFQLQQQDGSTTATQHEFQRQHSTSTNGGNNAKTAQIPPLEHFDLWDNAKGADTNAYSIALLGSARDEMVRTKWIQRLIRITALYAQQQQLNMSMSAAELMSSSSNASNKKAGGNAGKGGGKSGKASSRASAGPALTPLLMFASNGNGCDSTPATTNNTHLHRPQSWASSEEGGTTSSSSAASISAGTSTSHSSSAGCACTTTDGGVCRFHHTINSNCGNNYQHNHQHSQSHSSNGSAGHSGSSNRSSAATIDEECEPPPLPTDSTHRNGQLQTASVGTAPLFDANGNRISPSATSSSASSSLTLSNSTTASSSSSTSSTLASSFSSTMAATAETKMEEESAENSSAKTMAASGDLHLLHLSKNVNNRQRSSIQTKHAHAHTLVINQSQQQQQQATTKNYQQQQQQQQSLFVSSEAATVIIGNGHKSNGNDFTAGTIAGNERIGGALSPPIAMDLDDPSEFHTHTPNSSKPGVGKTTQKTTSTCGDAGANLSKVLFPTTTAQIRQQLQKQKQPAPLPQQTRHHRPQNNSTVLETCSEKVTTTATAKTGAGGGGVAAKATTPTKVLVK